MKRIALLFVLAVGSILPIRGDEARIARFDVQRVFDQYEHTKDMQKDIDSRRNVTGPQTERNALASERSEKLEQRLDELKSKLKETSFGTSEWERFELHVRLVAIEIKLQDLRRRLDNVEHDEALKVALKSQLDDVRRTLEAVDREAGMGDEVSQQRAEILNEIWAVASKLRTEHGYVLIVPVNGPSEDQFLTIIVSEKADDLTEALISRLNEEYPAKKSK